MAGQEQFTQGFDPESGKYFVGNQSGLDATEYSALLAEAKSNNVISSDNTFSGYSPSLGTYMSKGTAVTPEEYSANTQEFRSNNPDLATQADAVNSFDADTNTYIVQDVKTGEVKNYTDSEGDLPADVLYSKQIQANRAALGLAPNTTSSWELYKKGEHSSQISYKTEEDKVNKTKKIEEKDDTKVVVTKTDKEIKAENAAITAANTATIDAANIDDNSSDLSVVGTNTNTTSEAIAASNQDIIDRDPTIGSPVTLDVPQPVYYNKPVSTTQTFQPVATNQTGADTSTYGMSTVSGTQQMPLQTAGMSAVPQNVVVRPNYTGTTMQNLSSISQQGFGGQVVYVNKFGQRVTVSVDGTGKPLTYVPPGFKLGVPDGQGGYTYPVIAASDDATVTDGVTGVTTAAQGGQRMSDNFYNPLKQYALGGDVQGQLRLANKFLGYQGEATQESLNLFLNSNPGAAARMGQYEQAMKNMAQPIQKMYQGGQVQGYSNGNVVIKPFGSGKFAFYGDDGKQLRNSQGNTFSFGTPEEAANYYNMDSPTPNSYFNRSDTSTGSTLLSSDSYKLPDPTPAVPGATAADGTTPVVTDPGTFIPTDPNPYYDRIRPMGVNAIEQTLQPTQAPVNYIQPMAADFIGSTAGQTAPIAPMAEAATAANVTQSNMATASDAGQMTNIKKAATGVGTEVNKLSAQTGDKPGAITDEQQTTSAVTALDAATQDIFKPATNEYKRVLTKDPITGDFTELVSGSANAVTAAAFTEAIQVSTATPTAKATVAGQLAILMNDFEGGNTPAWASGSMRAATAAMAARGLGASSMAGQAIIQATMEAALPIAMADAQTQASFEAQNLSNRQARGMLAAQQRAAFMGQEFDQAFQARVQNAAKISDIANMNFTADQTIQLENSRNAQTLSLTNLSNSQAMVMAEAAALAGLDTQNLNNRQQAAVQNASNFLQVDMVNLTNKQQTAMFKTQQNVQALFTDQAAENASKQFNASSTNQTNQFFANLSTQTSQFNAAQTNAMDQFNLNAVNGLREFNANIQQQRDMFNAQNGLVIAQANAQWRQNLATINNATQNESNMDFAKTINGLTSKNIDAIWQRERDLMSNVNQSTESAKDRALSIIIADKELLAAKEALDYAEDVSNTQLLTRFLFPSLSGAGGLFSSV